MLLEGTSDAPGTGSSKMEDEEEETSAPARPNKRSSAELEKELARMSLSEFAPTEEAPPPPPIKKRPAESAVAVAESSPIKAELHTVPATNVTESVVVVAAVAAPPLAVTVNVEAELVPEKAAVVEKANSAQIVAAAHEIAEAKKEEERLKLVYAATVREAELMARIADMESQAQQSDAASKQRVRELEMQLDALAREKQHANAAPSEEPTRDELMAAMDAYRSKLAETDGELKKSEDRKTQLRDDLRKLITKSKEIEGNAKEWKQRCESFEAKFTKTKELAREYADRCKVLEKEKKALAASAATVQTAAAAAASAGDKSGDDLKQQLVAMERRAVKSEEMAKLAVAVIKKSGTSEQRKELAAALQALQVSSAAKAATTAEAKADRRKSPREPLQKTEPGGAPLLQGSAPSISISPSSGRAAEQPERKPVSSTSAPTLSGTDAGERSPRSGSSPPPQLKSPRLEVMSHDSDKNKFLSPQVARKQKLDFVQASAGGSKTPTIVRKKEQEKMPVQSSPSVRRHQNPGRSAASPQVQPKKQHADKTGSPPPVRKEDKKEDSNAFSLLEDVLMDVEKETGATGLSGAVDVSHVFGASTEGDASSYLASMRQEATAESEALVTERLRKEEQDVAAKREAVQQLAVAKRDGHRTMLSRYLEEEANYIEATIRDPLNPLNPLLPLLVRAEKVQSDAVKAEIMDAAPDTDFVGSELVLRVQLIEARDLKAPHSEVFAIVSCKAQHESSVVLPLPPNGVVQWNSTFLFGSVDAGSRLTITLMSDKTRLGVSQIQLRDLRGPGKEYYPIVDNSAGQSAIRGMLTAAVSLHVRVVKKSPVVVVLDPNSKSYQDAVRHNVAKIKRCEENKPKERDYQPGIVLTAWQKEMDQPRPNAQWLAAQIKAGKIAGDDPFENVYRRTLLHVMVIAGDIEMVEKCLAAGADPKKRDCFGMLPFHLAIVWGHTKLLQNMAPVMRAFGQSVHTQENACGLSPVHLAAIFNRPKILEWLLDQGADTDDKDDFGGLPIHKAAFVGSLGCVQVLVNKRAFVKAEDIDGNTPLQLAMKEGHWDVADYLLTNNVLKADLDTVNLAGENSLWFAVSRCNRRFTKLFLESPMCVSALTAVSGPNKWNVLMRALFELDEGAEEVLKVLVDAMVARGVGLNHRAADGKNAAFVAAFKGNSTILQYLGSRGCDLLAEDDNANTALHFAGVIMLAELLVQAGVGINSKNHQGNTALHAAYAFHPEVTDFLLSSGANPGVRNNSNLKPSDCSNLSASKTGLSYSGEVHRATCGLFIAAK